MAVSELTFGWRQISAVSRPVTSQLAANALCSE